MEVRQIGAEYGTILREAHDPRTQRRWYLLVRRWGRDAREILSRFGVPEGVPIRYTALERELYRMDAPDES